MAYVLCFPQYDMPLFSLLFAYLLVQSIHHSSSPRQSLAQGLILALWITVGGFHWIVYVAQNFGGLPFPVAVVLMLAYSLVAAPHLFALCYFGHRYRYKIETLPVFIKTLFWPALFIGLEHLARFIKIFPEHLGNTMISFSALSQLAAIGGVALLGFLPLWVGVSIYYAKKERAFIPLLVSVAVIGLATAWGKFEKERVENLPHKTLRIGLVQHNMEDVEKSALKGLSVTAIRDILFKLKSMSKTLAAQSPDLIVWPETAYPFVFPFRKKTETFGDGYANFVFDAVKELGVPLLFGGYESDTDRDYNSALLLGADGSAKDFYRKNVLLIFGEYFPLGDSFPSLRKLNPLMGNFGRGPGANPISLSTPQGEFRMGVNICYEAILPAYIRGFFNNGAEPHFLLNITKDSWYGDTFEPWQHFQLAALRAIENRVPLVRSTNTGLSGQVTLAGEFQLTGLPFRESASLVEVKVPINPIFTPFKALGEWFASLCLIFSLSIFLYISPLKLPKRKGGKAK